MRDHTSSEICQYSSCSHNHVTGELPPGKQLMVLDQNRDQKEGIVGRE